MKISKQILYIGIFVAAAFSALSGQVAHAFGPCTNAFPEGLSYSPSVEACDGKAAVILFGPLRNSFSAVVRDCNNNDRDPCHSGEKSCATNASSPFKAVKIVRGKVLRNDRQYDATIHCMRERGDSEVYKLVRRITVKKVNPVRKSSDVLKVCLRTRTSPVRPVTIVSTTSFRIPGNTGFNNACSTQGYLNCSIAYSDVCPAY